MSRRFVIRSIPRATLRRERDRVLSLLRDALPEWAEMTEVGSTAVEGVIGKEDIDVLVRVPAERFEHARALIDELIRRDPNQISSAVYQGYVVPSELDVAVQLTVMGGPHDNFLEFVRRLETDPALVERYNALKRAHDGGPMQGYRDAKREFIESVLGKE